MSSDLRIENILIQVKSQIRQKGIKLWLEPYYSDGLGPIVSEIEILALELSELVNIPFDNCRMAISELQHTALDNLRSLDEFNNTGHATIKVRAPNQLGGTRIIPICVKLTESGDVLQKLVANQLLIPPSRVKLISAGKVIDTNEVLTLQGIKNNQQIMAVVLDSSAAESIAENSIYDMVQNVRKDVEMFLERQDQDFVQLENQKGSSIYLPPKENKALLISLAMHDRGKTEMKKGNYSEALLLFLNADDTYRRCNSEILSSADNYALLNLDIAWCYLCLKNVTQLPDAEIRLNFCENTLKQTYGPNFERVVAVKGDTGNERALIMRLHLMQAVVLFHQNRRPEALNMIVLAESEFNQLKIKEESICALAEMGYTESEARVGLRACGGNIDRAVTHIIDKRIDRQLERKRTMKERKVMKRIRQSKDNTWVNPRCLTTLVEMGFPIDQCEVALKLTENNVNGAITLLKYQPTLLKQKVNDDFKPDSKISDLLLNMGFNKELIDINLRLANNNMTAAIDLIIKMQTESTENSNPKPSTSNSSSSSSHATPSTSSTQPEANENNEEDEDDDDDEEVEEKYEEEVMEAFERFADGISRNEDDYLDLTFTMEENILNEYKKYLLM